MLDPVQPSGNPAPVQTLPPGRRDAMVFIPGLGDQRLGPDQSVDGIARRISTALNVRANTASASFRAEVREQAYGPNDCYTARVSTVYRRDGPDEVALLDIYGMDYNRTLTARFERQNVLVKLLLTLLQLLYGLRLLVRSAGKSWREKVQILYAGSILLLLAAYMIVVVIAAIDIGVNAVGPGQTPPPPAATAPQAPDLVAAVGNALQRALSTVGDWYAPYRRYVRAGVVILAALGVVIPTSGFKAQLSAAATTYLCALYYLRLGERRNELIAQLEALIERTAELEGVQYERTHLVAYSFGTVVAIDALFRLGHEAPPSRFQRIETLITIGCPFDLIRTYWPAYFTRRTALPPDGDQPKPPARWLNIYSPLDVLGSNFRDNGGEGPAEVGVELAGEAGGATSPKLRMPDNNVSYGAGADPGTSLRLWDWLTLIGFQVHGFYWNREDEPSTDCFSEIVEALYKGQQPLS